VTDEQRMLWPEDALTYEEWAQGWFDRQVIAGRLPYTDRSITPRAFGGESDTATRTPPLRRAS
jgi:hypothetical protein